jgi:hypothetical protein
MGKDPIAVGVPLMVKVPPLKVPLRLQGNPVYSSSSSPPLIKSDIVYGNVYTFGLIISTCPDVKLIAARIDRYYTSCCCLDTVPVVA